VKVGDALAPAARRVLHVQLCQHREAQQRVTAVGDAQRERHRAGALERDRSGGRRACAVRACGHEQLRRDLPGAGDAQAGQVDRRRARRCRPEAPQGLLEDRQGPDEDVELAGGSRWSLGLKYSAARPSELVQSTLSGSPEPL